VAAQAWGAGNALHRGEPTAAQGDAAATRCRGSAWPRDDINTLPSADPHTTARRRPNALQRCPVAKIPTVGTPNVATRPGAALYVVDKWTL